MVWLWQNLTSMYGHLFTASYGSKEAILLWKNGLNKIGVGRPEIKRALAQCLELYTSPPSLPQFIELCKVYRRRECDNPNKELSNVKPDWDNNHEQMSKILSMLKR